MPKDGKIKIEDHIQATQKHIDEIAEVYQDFYTYRNYRSGNIRQLQYNSFNDYLRKSRELFWNSIFFESEDLGDLDLQLTIPFARKEVMEFISRIIALGIKPRVTGDSIDAYSIKILNGLYQRWRFKSIDKVQKFWQSIYGVINGTVCTYIGYNGEKRIQRFLKEYNPETGDFRIEEEARAYWDDVETCIVPLEDIYLSKIYERNIQKQGKLIWKTQMDPDEFYAKYKGYRDIDKVVPGNRVAEDSLYFQLLGGTGVTTTNKIELMRSYDTDNDKFKLVANGIWINRLGDDTAMPMPFDHKMMPFSWSINEPIDEKFAYGLSMTFKIKDPHKILNASYVMLMERELRAINQPMLSSDIETPEIVYKTGKVIPVGDVSAYKQLEMSEASSQFFTSLNSMQGLMTSQAQGGSSQIIPSIQPKSSKEIQQMEQLRQQAMGSALLMYYDMNRQEIMLALKTMLQFYPLSKYSKDKDRILKTLMIPDMDLSQGGIGNIELRLVTESEDPKKLYFESILKGFQNKKQTEIIEAPVDFIQNLEFYIKDIDLEPQKTDEIEQSIWMESTFTPIMQYFVPNGLVSPEKALLRMLEKKGESPADWVSDQNLASVMSSWNSDPRQAISQGKFPGMDRAGAGGAAAQSPVGAANGGLSFGGQGFNAGVRPAVPKV